MERDNKLKPMLVEMMGWFHNFCVNHNLRYYAAGGTMLGAIRHKGFIPWDDDIDIVMPRTDYEKLEQLMKNQVCKRYLLETPNTDAKDFFYTFSKLYDTETTLIENTKYKIKRGIYLDIFPLDGMGNSEKESRKHFRKIEKANNLLLSKIAGIRKGRSFIKNTVVRVFRVVPLNEKKLLNKVVRLCAEKDWDKCAYGGNPVGAWRFKEIMRKEIMGTPTLYKFENIEIFGAEMADEYLKHLYGDWRKLPPIEKRVSHHDYILCDLNQSYLKN